METKQIIQEAERRGLGPGKLDPETDRELQALFEESDRVYRRFSNM